MDCNTNDNNKTAIKR